MAVIASGIVPGTEGFVKATTDGKVYSCRSYGNKKNKKSEWRELLGKIDKYGYRVVHIRLNGKSRVVRIHTLILLTFKGPRPNGYEARHYPDSTKTNTSLSNLSWSSRHRNMKDRKEHGCTMWFGENNGNAKLTWRQVKEIKNLYRTGKYTQQELGRKYGVTQPSIQYIVAGKSWKK